MPGSDSRPTDVASGTWTVRLQVSHSLLLMRERTRREGNRCVEGRLALTPGEPALPTLWVASPATAREPERLRRCRVRRASRAQGAARAGSCRCSARPSPGALTALARARVTAAR